MISTNKLVAISLVGVSCCYGIIVLFQKKLSETLKTSNLYKEAISIVKNHEASKHFLGEPIEDFQPQLVSNSFTFKGISEAKVNVCGPKSKGVVYITVIGDTSEDLKLDSVQLQVGLDKSKRLVLKECSRELNIPK